MPHRCATTCAVLCLCLTGALHAQVHPATARTAAAPAIDWNAPLPSAAELKQRVLTNLKNSQAAQERYVCKVTEENDLLTKSGSVKSSKIQQFNMFFVNGQEIDQKTANNGKPLDAGQQKKESERVMREIKKDSDQKYVAKQDADQEKQLDMLLHVVHYTNGHRINLNGRPTLAYDLSGDPAVHPKGIEETFLHSMDGTILVDEQTGQLVDLNARLDHDVKVGGGLLANLHKGFTMHLHQQRYPDGVWLPDQIEGSGDARAALFLHPYFRFSRAISDCKRTNVTTSETAAVPAAPAAKP